MFQKRHYEAIAKELGEAMRVEANTMRQQAINDFAHQCASMFGHDNPLFDRGRFLNAVSKHAGWKE